MYHVSDSELRFTDSSEEGTVEYRGLIQSDGDLLELRVHSHINGYSATYTYRFVPVAFGK